MHALVTTATLDRPKCPLKVIKNLPLFLFSVKVKQFVVTRDPLRREVLVWIAGIQFLPASVAEMLLAFHARHLM